MIDSFSQMGACFLTEGLWLRYLRHLPNAAGNGLFRCAEAKPRAGR